MAVALNRTSMGAPGAAQQRVKPLASLASLSSPGAGASQSPAAAGLNKGMSAYSATNSNPLAANGTANPGYQPNTNLNANQNANYSAEFANNDAMGKQIQDLGDRQSAMGQRQAAYLASMSGGSGGYFQSGQIAAGIAGTANTEQQLLANNQNRQGIYNAKAGDLGNLQTGAQSFNNQTALQGQQRGYALQDQGASNAASALSSQASTKGTQWNATFKNNPNSDATGDMAKAQSALSSAVAAYTSKNPSGNPWDDPSVQAALSDVNNFNAGNYRSDGKRKTANKYGGVDS